MLKTKKIIAAGYVSLDMMPAFPRGAASLAGSCAGWQREEAILPRGTYWLCERDEGFCWAVRA